MLSLLPVVLVWTAASVAGGLSASPAKAVVAPRAMLVDAAGDRPKPTATPAATPTPRPTAEPTPRPTPKPTPAPTIRSTPRPTASARPAVVHSPAASPGGGQGLPAATTEPSPPIASGETTPAGPHPPARTDLPGTGHPPAGVPSAPRPADGGGTTLLAGLGVTALGIYALRRVARAHPPVSAEDP